MLEKTLWKASIRRHLLRHHHHPNNNNNTGILTLKATVPKTSAVDLLILSSPPRFVPQFQPLVTPSVETESRLHYDSRRGVVTLEHEQAIYRLTVDEYSWIVRELHQEEHLPSSSSVLPSRVLAIRSSNSKHHHRHSNSIRKMMTRQKVVLLLLVPKTLLLHAATHIPMSKPLPPPVHCLVPSSFDIVPDDMYDRLCWYIRMATLPDHDMHHTDKTAMLHVGMVCRRCLTRMDSGTAASPASLEVVVSSSPCSSEDDDDDDNDDRNRRQQQKRRTTAAAAPAPIADYLPSLMARRRPLSTPPERAAAAPQRQKNQCEYTLCVDRDKEEIIVAFGYDSPPGPFPPHHLHDGVSVVPWPEGGWVLEWAAAQWRQVEMPVATALMRLCRTTPENYRVVLVGFRWGGALAALCASSLVITGLLTRHVTLCVMDAPRIGSVDFIDRLQKYKIETIRVMRLGDTHSLWPPRTTGLCHLGETTVLWINNQAKMLRSKRCWDWIEDELTKLYRSIKVDPITTDGDVAVGNGSAGSRKSTSTRSSSSNRSHSQHQDLLLGIPVCCRMRK